ncbi:flagellar protein FlaG [Bacillus sp. S3]|uniref:flagellar protein FlaG n=1 Tax=Bacillus sp. S3 TaxID=486398 RepID=UPI00118C63BC|nr:flagellar protein FlaG [Bacillus sp. S3]QCJ42381.1 flagellar protein FlaG [Bacillus sp. S3]
MLEKLTNNNPSADFQVKQVELVPKVKEITKEKQEQQEQQALSKERTEKVIESMNDFLKESNTHLEFQFHEGLQKYYVAIVDDTTNEVIKEIPPKKLLDMYAEMTDYLGLLVDKKA